MSDLHPVYSPKRGLVSPQGDFVPFDAVAKKADMHLHSSYSGVEMMRISAVTPLALHQEAKLQGMDYMTITDHNTMDGVFELMHLLSLPERYGVIPGVELDVKDPKIGFTIHVIVSMPRECLKYADDLTTLERRCKGHLAEVSRYVPSDVVAYCDEQGLFSTYEHNFWFDVEDVIAGRVDPQKVPDIADQFHILGINGSRPRRHNLVTLALGLTHGKSFSCGSDAHSGRVGLSYLVCYGETIVDFMENVKNGRHVYPVFNGVPYDELREDLNELLDFFRRGERASIDDKIASLDLFDEKYWPVTLSDAVHKLFRSNNHRALPPGFLRKHHFDQNHPLLVKAMFRAQRSKILMATPPIRRVFGAIAQYFIPQYARQAREQQGPIAEEVETVVNDIFEKASRTLSVS